MKIVRFLIYLFILSIPLGELGRFTFLNNVNIHIGEIFLVFAVLFWLVQILKEKTFASFKSFLTKPLAIFIGVCLLSLLVNIRFLNLNSVFVSFSYLARFVLYSLLFFIVKDFDSGSKKNILKLLVFGSAVFVAGGLVQFFLYPNLRNLYYLGWDEHLYRLFSSFLDPNFAAIFISLFITLLLSLLFYFKKNRKALIGTAVVSALSFVALLLTYSRTGYLMFGVSILVFFLLQKKYLLPIVLLLVLAIGLFVIPKNKDSEGAHLFRLNSVYNRTVSDENALTVFSKNPVLGVGFNAYEYAQVRYKLIKPSQYPNHSIAGADNSFLFVLATTGIAGFAAYLYLQWSIVRHAFVTFRKDKDKLRQTLALAFLASIAGLLVSALFINSLFYSFIMAWVWILLGLTES